MSKPSVISHNYIAGASGLVDLPSCKLLLACPWCADNADGVGGPTGMTWHGVAMTELYNGGGTLRTDTAWWAKITPDIGNFTLAATGGSGIRALAWLAISSVPTSGYYHAGGVNNSNSINSISATVAAAVDELMLYSVINNNNQPISAVGSTLLDMYQSGNGAGANTYEFATGVSESGGGSWVNNSYATVMGISIIGRKGGGGRWWFSSRKWKHFLEDLRWGLLPPDVLKQRWAEVLRPI